MRLADVWKKIWSIGVPRIAQVPLAIAVLVILCWQYSAMLDAVWGWYLSKENREAVVPLATGAGGLLALGVAFGQFKTARLRHEEQTRADGQRRLTETFSTAIEQLGSDKLEIRLGGIFTLEWISTEGLQYYWTVMETLTAFVRERSRWREFDADDEPIFDFQITSMWAYKMRCEADVQAAMTVIGRRNAEGGGREKFQINLSGTDLRSANLERAHLKGADLSDAHLEDALLGGARLDKARLKRAHLERAYLEGVHLEGALLAEARLEDAFLIHAHLEEAYLTSANLDETFLIDAHLEGATLSAAHFKMANLRRSHLKQAILSGAHLEGADLSGADLEGADLESAHLEGANLRGAHLEGANLRGAEGLEASQIADAYGDSSTVLPDGMQAPESWLNRKNKMAR